MLDAETKLADVRIKVTLTRAKLGWLVDWVGASTKQQVLWGFAGMQQKDKCDKALSGTDQSALQNKLLLRPHQSASVSYCSVLLEVTYIALE